MRFVSQAELGILAWVLLRAVTYVPSFPLPTQTNHSRHSFRGSFLTAIFLAHFIRMRYISSAYTRQAVSAATQTIDRFLVGKPPALANAWGMGKTVVGNWMGMTIPVQQGPGVAAGGAAPAAGAAGRR